ncbi:3-dehydroquinate dehydratase [Brevundimonas sp. Leaf363]|uniref:type II 3-dehydroquinate dehydratase n=1 Tax=Brevundimonas sp. Leaf363 TaxID=1736353 RepID=UPI0006F4804A|nr:type II 3-dehydroquinate dehydratase [Brevundimonas sp. Leaf363]KQS56001.1 3-dehydroquinate dehydratase [Brevundimonas sp. Leaf363]
MPDSPVLYVLNGPNLNLLGTREPAIYGSATLADAENVAKAAAGGLAVVFRQTNHEGQLIDWIHEAGREAAGLVLNPAAYGHTSVALLDALKSLSIPIVECHLSNPLARESFRHQSYVSPVATGIVSGFGVNSYDLAVRAAVTLIRERAAA